MCSCGRTFVTELGKVLLRCLGMNLLGLADSLVWLDAVLFVSFVPQYLVPLLRLLGCQFCDYLKFSN